MSNNTTINNMSRDTINNMSRNALNMSRQNPFRTGIAQQKKKKAHALVQKVAQKSKNIKRGEDYLAKLKKKGKKMSLKKRASKGESPKQIAQFRALASRKMKNKEKRRLNKTLWETTHDQINREDITDDEDEDFEDVDSDDNEVEDSDEEIADQNNNIKKEGKEEMVVE